MLSAKSLVRVVVLLGFGLVLNACGGSKEEKVTYTVGGTVSGLTGAGLVLKNNGGNALTITTNGSFTFNAPVKAGGSYAVTVSANPVLQVCTVAAGSGVAAAAVTNILVTCAASAYTIGGTVSGLTGAGLVLKNNGGDDLTITTNGSFTFNVPVTVGGSYAVTVWANPVLQACEVVAGAGLAAATVTNILVTCAAPVPHTIGGTVAGLTGTLVLRNNGGNDLSIAANGAFTFGATVNHDAAYAVAVQTPPAGQLCAVTNAFGFATAAVTNVAVTCSTPAPVPRTIGGTVSGLTTSGLALKNNGGDTLAITANGAFTFSTLVNTGGTYAVTISVFPLGQFCAVSAGAGAVTADVTSVLVSCVPLATRTISGTVSGLAGTVVLQVNGSNNLSVTADGAFMFPAQINNGPYVVRVLTQPAGQVCTVNSAGSDNGFGGHASGNVTNVGILCTTPPGTSYSVGGNIAGMTSSGMVMTLTRNGTLVEALAPLGANLTSFMFATPLANGDTWAVAVTWTPNVPLNQGCQFVGSTSGTIAAANVNALQISCSNITAIISGTVTMASGTLAPGLVLRNNGGDDREVFAGETQFQFATTQNIPSNFRVTIKSQPAGQTCTVVNGNGPASLANQGGGTAVEIRCLNLRTTTSLSGVYTVAETGSAPLPGYYLALFSDGTYLFTSRADSPGECPVNGGNGVEYGVYNFNAVAKTLRFENAVVDTNGNCGLMEAAPFVAVLANAIQNGSTKVITGNILDDEGPRNFTFTPVASIAGQLLGAWTATKLGLVIYRSDNTILFATAETSRSSTITGVEEACFAGAAPSATSGSVAFNYSSTCMPHGSAVMDTNGVGAGYSVFGTGPVSFTVSGDTMSFGGGTAPLIQTRIVTN